MAACAPGVPGTSQIPRLLNRQYSAVVRDLLGLTTLASANNQPPGAGLYADFEGPTNVDAWRLYQEVGDKIATEVMAGPNKSKFITCNPATAGCLTDTIRTFGRKAFRRPLTDAEVARFEKLGQTTPKGTPDEIAQTTLYAFLVSPSFLQIPELATTTENGNIKLSSYEVAARLSFLLWDSIPDDVLRDAADKEQLDSKEKILAQAKRMIAIRDKAAPLIAAYHRKYLDMDNDDSHWWKVSHDSGKFPLYSTAAVSVFQDELDLFFEDVAFGGGSFEDLFLSNVGYVNKDTAAIYDLDPKDFGTELKRVTLDADRRPGFLTRAGFLSSYSHYDATSPILRGAFVTVYMIGVNPGTPDPAFFLMKPPQGDYKTERAYTEALTSQSACTGCHTPFVNPPGFVLEKYDSIGKWQTVDPRSGGDADAGKIDGTATVTFSAGNVKKINTPRELMEEITKTPMAKRMYAEKAVAFATRRVANANDACTVNVLNTKLAEDGFPLLDVFTEMTQADSFRFRVKGN